MQDRPDPVELLEAVATFLREHVAASTEGRVSFHARVAANMLDIVRREIELGPQSQARELQGLRALLGADAPAGLAQANRLLCERIAAGLLDAAAPELHQHLLQTARDKLAIDQPGYAAAAERKD